MLFFADKRLFFHNTDTARYFCRVIKNMEPMKKFIGIFAAALLVMSCDKGGTHIESSGFLYDDGLQHGMIVLGSRLDNPYTTENARAAFSAVYPTKSRDIVQTTDLYVRFLPADQEEFDLLEEMGVEMLDHPMDYEIVAEGDYYHDPSVGDGNITWQYAVVDKDFDFPDIRYEIIDECFLADNSEATKAMADIDWEAVEKESYRLTGNGDMLDESALTKATKYNPTGRITIVDEQANGGKPFGLAGVKISCNTFIKFSSTYTDRDGYYTIPKRYSAKLRYRLVFQNAAGFSIGFNLVLVPASVSTLGKGSAQGMNYTVTRSGDDMLYRRSVVSNAAYDYISRCAPEDMNLPAPPGDIRIWLFNSMSASSAVMIHHGAVVENALIKSYLGVFSLLIKFFAPDITIGTKDHGSYAELYDSTVHELAHSSHFAQVGTEYWNRYIRYILQSFIETGGETYGTGDGEYAGHCEVGEMWAYYVESMMHKERYGGQIPAYGTSFWFYPQIFRYLEDRGLTRAQLLAALQGDVTDKQKLREKLVELYPDRRIMIEQVFNRYR